LPNIQPSYYYEFKREFHFSIKLIRISTALRDKCELNFFKLKSDASREVTGDMDPLFQDLIEHQRENLKAVGF
jgi:hypothetical protein